MFNFFHRQKKEAAFVALDIGTTVIKALIFTVEQKYNKKGEQIGKRAIIQGMGKVSHFLNDIHNTAITDVASVANSAKRAILEAIVKIPRLVPQKFIMGVGGEFVRGITMVMEYKREEGKETKIDLSELQNIVHKLQWKAFGESRKALSEEMGYPEIDIKLIESAIVDIAIDGYKVSNPLGFQGKTIQLSIFNAFAPLVHFEALQAIVSEINLESLGIVSEPYALSRCLNEYSSEKSVILIDVGGFSTDLTLLEKGVLSGTKIFSIGSHTITKRIATELNISLEEAEKIKLAYTSDKLEKKSKKWIEKIIVEDISVWLSGLILALSDFQQIKVLPSKILLCGGGAYLSEIKEALTQTKWYQKLPFYEKPEIAFITPSHLTNNLIDETRQLKNNEDIIPLSLVNSGLELLEEEAIMQKVLKKVIGIMKI
ncbi:hypothetical protein HZA43_03510 [Candidatus Peregrinibacteria bacterium]|nr:hypothetical protein [Candidatus Peregrinibacteria bacterium]